MPMRLHRGVLGQGKPPSPAPSKERPFLPRLQVGGILARFGELKHVNTGTSWLKFTFLGALPVHVRDFALVVLFAGMADVGAHGGSLSH